MGDFSSIRIASAIRSSLKSRKILQHSEIIGEVYRYTRKLMEIYIMFMNCTDAVFMLWASLP